MKKNQKSPKKFKPTKEDFKELYKLLAIVMPIALFFLLGGIYDTYRVNKVLRERGVVTTMTIYQISMKYLEYEYNVNRKAYSHQTRYNANIEYNIGDKFKLVYDPLDPETHLLIRDKEKDPIPANGKEKDEKYTDFKP